MMSSRLRIKGVVLLLIVCLFYWVIDSVWSYLSFELNLEKLIYFEPNSIIDTLLLSVPPYQIVSRIIVVFLFFIFGMIALEFIIKKHEIENERKEAYHTLLTVLNSIDATIYVADLNTYEIIFMNQNMRDAFGGDLTGEICYEAFRGSRDVCTHCTNSKLLDENGNPKGVVAWEVYNPIVNAWYMNYDRAIKWTDGRIVHLQIAIDVTRLKELQEKKEQAESSCGRPKRWSRWDGWPGGSPMILIISWR